MNKIYITIILLFGGCASSSHLRDEPITSEQYDPDQVAQRAKELGLRPVDYLHRANNESLNPRYEVRIGFSDYTYSNGTWKDMVFASYSLKESKKYLNEHKIPHAPLVPLVVYDLRAGVILP